MDLLTRTVVIALVLILVILGIFYALQNTILAHVSVQQAVSLVTADLQGTNPNAIINITNVTASTYAGSWHIVAGVITNATTPCPSYFVYTFDYPQFGFVYRVQNTYTSNCVIYGLAQNKTFIISSFPIAITRSYNLMPPAIISYLNVQGINNVVVTAHFYNKLNAQGNSYTNVWLVNYTSKKVAYSAYALLSQVNGTLLSAYNASR